MRDRVKPVNANTVLYRYGEHVMRAHGQQFIQQCIRNQSEPVISVASLERVIIGRLTGGLGNQLLASLSLVVLACLTGRTLIFEDAPHGLFSQVFSLPWDLKRATSISQLNQSYGLRGVAVRAVDLSSQGPWQNHARLACDRDISTFDRLLVSADGYFLKALLVNRWHRNIMADVCPVIDRCFEILFSTLMAPRPHVLQELKALLGEHPLPCAVGVHMRSTETLSPYSCPCLQRPCPPCTTSYVHTMVEAYAKCTRFLLDVAAVEGARVTTCNDQKHANYFGCKHARENVQIFVASGSQSLLRDFASLLDNDTRLLWNKAVVFPPAQSMRSWSSRSFRYNRALLTGAAVDLLALARCKRLVGTPRSTFSYAAQAIFSAQQAQVHMVAGPNGSRTPSESCRLYNHTQPAYHAWMRYHEMPGMLLKSHEGLYRDCFLEFHDSPRSNDVFALEYTVPGREQ